MLPAFQTSIAFQALPSVLIEARVLSTGGMTLTGGIAIVVEKPVPVPLRPPIN